MKIQFYLSQESYDTFEKLRREREEVPTELEFARELISGELRKEHPDRVHPDKDYKPLKEENGIFTYLTGKDYPAAFLMELEEEDMERLEAVREDIEAGAYAGECLEDAIAPYKEKYNLFAIFGKPKKKEIRDSRAQLALLPSFHKRVKDAAERRGMSFNAFVEGVLEAYLSLEPEESMSEKLK